MGKPYAPLSTSLIQHPSCLPRATFVHTGGVTRASCYDVIIDVIKSNEQATDLPSHSTASSWMSLLYFSEINIDPYISAHTSISVCASVSSEILFSHVLLLL